MRPFGVVIAAFALAACASAPEADRVPPPSLEKIAEDVWVHMSFKDIPPFGPVLSQGLVVKGADGLFLVDTGWDDRSTRALIRLAEKTAGAPVVAALATHAHDDKMGGMKALNTAGVRTLALDMTNADAPARGLTPATESLVTPLDPARIDADIAALVAAAAGLEVFYPGPAHARDNVVYHAASKTLFGGCLIRPRDAKNLGNRTDADVSYWATAVRAVAARFPEAETVVPSHGARGGRDLLHHTIDLAEAAKAAQE
jgi:glyoxylase-like metal-dependent hydrolase (beta-lactamase superfamily II)